MPIAEMHLPWPRPDRAPGGRDPAPRRRRGWRVALALLAAFVLFAAAFDWDWCRPLLKRYIESHSGRRFECARLQVRFDRSLDPTITLTGVRIENAPWASAKMPFLQARSVAATVAWRSLWDPLVVVPLIVLEDAQVDMERQADGLRNWRLGRPDDRGPPHVRVLALDARNSRLHAVHRGIGLEVDAQSTPLPAPQALAAYPGLPLTRRLQFKGTVKGRAFDGDVQVSDRLGFGAAPPSAQFFALRGAARFEGWRLEAAGVSDDVHALGDLDVDVHLASDATLSRSPWPLPETLAGLRPIAAQAHVKKSGDTWTGIGLEAAMGHGTHLAGDVDFTGSWRSDGPRRRVRATLRDAVVDVDDLRPLHGQAPAAGGADADRAWSAKPLDIAPLRAFDGELTLQQARLVGSGRAVAPSLRGRASLANGLLQLRDLDLGLAGGHVTGSLRVDAAHVPTAWWLDAGFRGLRLDQLSPALAGNGGLAGAVDGRAALETRGDSMRALVANARGTAGVALAAGATVSRRLDAKLGLDGGAWLRSLFDKSARVPVACGALDLAIAHGMASSRRFVFETADTTLAGHGDANLAQQTLDLEVTPVHRGLALLSLDKAIHVEGSWHQPKISLRAPDGQAPLRCPGAQAG